MYTEIERNNGPATQNMTTAAFPALFPLRAPMYIGMDRFLRRLYRLQLHDGRPYMMNGVNGIFLSLYMNTFCMCS